MRKAAERLGVSKRTLVRWEQLGKLVPAFRLESGARRYSEAQLDAFLGAAEGASDALRAAYYARVSSSKQKADGNLGRQQERLESYIAGRGWELVVPVSEVASGVNERRRGVARLLLQARKGNIDVVVVEFKDRLARFGYRYLEAAFEASGVRVVVIDEATEVKQPAQELIDDLLAIVMVFAARLYGQRGSKVRRQVSDVLNGEPLEDGLAVSGVGSGG